MGRGWAGEAGGGDEKNPIATGCSRDPDRQTPACVGGTAVALDREALVGALGGGVHAGGGDSEVSKAQGRGLWERHKHRLRFSKVPPAPRQAGS